MRPSYLLYAYLCASSSTFENGAILSLADAVAVLRAATDRVGGAPFVRLHSSKSKHSPAGVGAKPERYEMGRGRGAGVSGASVGAGPGWSGRSFYHGNLGVRIVQRKAHGLASP
jgi:hypothetical protein